MTEHPIYAEAISLMNLHSLTDKGWRFEISTHKTFVGMCYHDRRVIAYSACFLSNSPEEITDTLLHEIAHALVGPGQGHNETWKHMARFIGAKGNRCAEGVPTASPNYLIKCIPCGWTEERFRLRKSMHSATCATCGNLVTIESLLGGN